MVAEMVETSPAMAKRDLGPQDRRTPGAVSRTPMTRHLEQTGGFDETAVVNRARNGDFRAFTELVERYEASIFRLTRHFTRSQSEAEEALQETFLEAWEDLGELRGDSGFRPWLIRIAVRQARMRLRAHRTAGLAGRMNRSRWRGSRTAHWRACTRISGPSSSFATWKESAPRTRRPCSS